MEITGFRNKFSSLLITFAEKVQSCVVKRLLKRRLPYVKKRKIRLCCRIFSGVEDEWESLKDAVV